MNKKIVTNVKFKKLPDTQNEESSIYKRIKKVGIRNIKIPIKIYGSKGRKLNTVADVSIYSSLTAELRGSHMSRYVEILYSAVRKEISLDIVIELLKQIQYKLQSKDAYVKFTFTYFVKKKSPISKKYGFVPYEVSFEGEITDKARIYLVVSIPYTSCCPCSKAISRYGAHNQRSMATVKVELRQPDKYEVKIEDIINLVEGCVSSDIYSTLKRNDEKYVTEQAYENPMFSEDIAREIATQLDTWLDTSIVDYYVVVNHFESIHPHDAVAVITADRDLQ